MLIASVISISASSPASGDIIVDFNTHPQNHQQTESNFQLPRQAHHKQDEASLFNNFKQTVKHLKFEDN